MKKKMLAGVLALLLVCVAFSGCGEEPSPYNWEVSILDTFDPQQGCLSELPWFTTIDEAKEILHLADLPDGAYQLNEEDERQQEIVVKNVKLKEYRIPVDLKLTFEKNPSMTGKEGMLLVDYMFYVPEIDGYSIAAPDSPPFNSIPEETREEFLQAQEEDRQACIQALLQRSDVIGTEAEWALNDILQSGGITMSGVHPELPDPRYSVQAFMQFDAFMLYFQLGWY